MQTPTLRDEGESEGRVTRPPLPVCGLEARACGLVKGQTLVQQLLAAHA